MRLIRYGQRCVTDDAGNRVPVRGKLLKNTLDPFSFSIGRPDDPPLRDVVNGCITLITFCWLALTVFTPFALVQRYGCWLFPVAAVLAWWSFHQTRVLVSRRADEWELEQKLDAYRTENCWICPACDASLREADEDGDGLRPCPDCDARWLLP